MDDLTARICEGMAAYVRRQSGGSERPKCLWRDITGVAAWNEDLPNGASCDTCGPEPITVMIYCDTPSGEGATYFYYGSLGELITEITQG